MIQRGKSYSIPVIGLPIFSHWGSLCPDLNKLIWKEIGKICLVPRHYEMQQSTKYVPN